MLPKWPSLLTTYTISMSIAWHNNNHAALAGISLPLHLTLSFSPLFALIDTIMFVYSFTIEGYNVIVTIEFFPQILILEDFFSLEPLDDDFGDVHTLLKL